MPSTVWSPPATSLPGGWFWGENIAWYGTTTTTATYTLLLKIHNNLFLSPYHRANLLYDDYRELGPGVVSGNFTSGKTTYKSLMVTEDFALSGSDVFVTGVAIYDLDGDSFYDIGEAHAGVTVSVSSGGVLLGTSATATSGGYAVAIASGGSLDVTFSGGGLGGTVSVSVESAGRNVKVDLANDNTVVSSATATLGPGATDLVLIGAGNLKGIGTSGSNVLIGNRGNNELLGQDGGDILKGAPGNDQLVGGQGSDTLLGDYGNDVLFGDEAFDFTGVNPGAGDTLIGGAGVDTLYGAAGNDILIGGTGRDTLTGGVGLDFFDFNSVAESTRGSSTRDTIMDFQRGTDRIDLRTIDAKPGISGNNAFTWIGTGKFQEKKGELHYIHKGSTCLVQADVNGDGGADFEIFVKVGSLSKSDFLL